VILPCLSMDCWASSGRDLGDGSGWQQETWNKSTSLETKFPRAREDCGELDATPENTKLDQIKTCLARARYTNEELGRNTAISSSMYLVALIIFPLKNQSSWLDKEIPLFLSFLFAFFGEVPAGEGAHSSKLSLTVDLAALWEKIQEEYFSK